jgi:hypothetical protein
MNIGNAFGFVGFGLVMWLLPALAPQWFPATSIDGSSARALWIQIMAVVQGAIGAIFLLRLSVLPKFVRWLGEEPALAASWRRGAVPTEAVPVDLQAAEAELLQQSALLAARELEANGRVSLRSQHAALWRALKVTFLDEKRFVHFLERLRLLAHRDRDGAHADGAAAVIFRHDAEHALVHLIQARGINLEELERRSRNWLGNVTSGAFLREVADEIDQVVGHTRRAA